MPVTIVPTATSDPREISLAEYQDGRDKFTSHYFTAPSSEASDFYGQDFKVLFGDLNSAVDTFCADNDIDPETVALRFVHCFDGNANSLYLRMQICTMTFSGTVEGYEEYTLITTPCAWYKLKDNSFETTTNEDLEGTEYLNTFYYKDAEASFQSLAAGPTTYVKNFVYPWSSEILLMYQNNGSPADASIHFAACSYFQPVLDPNLTYPHGNVCYLSTPTKIYLENGSSLVVFENRGADSATLCPPECGVYIDPVLPE